MAGRQSAFAGDAWIFWLSGLQSGGAYLTGTTPGLTVSCSVLLNNEPWGGPFTPDYDVNLHRWGLRLELPGPGSVAVRWLIVYGLLEKTFEQSLFVESRKPPVSVEGQSNLDWDVGPQGPVGPMGPAGQLLVLRADGSPMFPATTLEFDPAGFSLTEVVPGYGRVALLGPDLAALDARYVNVVGDSMTGPLIVSGTTRPGVLLDDTDAGADKRFWRVTNVDGTFSIQAMTDAQGATPTGAAAASAFAITRVGAAPAIPTLPGLAGTGTRRVMADAAGTLSAENPAGMLIEVLPWAGAAKTWTNMPLATTILFGDTLQYYRIDTSSFRQALLVTDMAVAGAVGSTITVRFGQTLSTADTVVPGMANAIQPAQVVNSGWKDLHANNIFSDGWMTLWGQGGDGVIDPQFRRIHVFLR